MKEVTEVINNDNLLLITKYIVEEHKINRSVKLQKILYFLYLEYLKKNNEKLFEEEFEAWVYGPVIPKIFYFIQDHGFDFSEYFDYEQDKIIEINQLNDIKIKEFIDNDIKKYKKCNSEELVNLSHGTFPWVKARKGCTYHEPSNEKIKYNDLRKFCKTWNFS